MAICPCPAAHSSKMWRTMAACGSLMRRSTWPLTRTLAALARSTSRRSAQRQRPSPAALLARGHLPRRPPLGLAPVVRPLVRPAPDDHRVVRRDDGPQLLLRVRLGGGQAVGEPLPAVDAGQQPLVGAAPGLRLDAEPAGHLELHRDAALDEREVADLCRR